MSCPRLLRPAVLLAGLLILAGCSSRKPRPDIREPDIDPLAAALEEVEKAPAGDVAGFLNGRPNRRELAANGDRAAKALEKAEVAWLERTAEKALADAAKQLEKGKPEVASARLRRLVQDLS